MLQNERKNERREQIRSSNIVEKESRAQEKRQWQPIVGIDKDYFDHNQRKYAQD